MEDGHSGKILQILGRKSRGDRAIAIPVAERGGSSAFANGIPVKLSPWWPSWRREWEDISDSKVEID
jgi:hypothetical protein